MFLVVPWSGRRLLARIGAAIGKYDRGGVIRPLNRSENDDRGGVVVVVVVICIGRLHFDLRNLNGQSQRRFRNLLISLAQGSLILHFLGFFPLAFQPGLLWWNISEGDGVTRQRWSGWSGKVSQGWGWKQISWIVIGVSWDQGFLIRSGCDRADQGPLMFFLGGGVKVFPGKPKVDLPRLFRGCRASSKKHGCIEVRVYNERLLFGPKSKIVWLCMLKCRGSQRECRKRAAL